MKTATITELRKNVRRYIDSVEEGEPIQVLRHGKPVAEIRPLRNPRTPSWKRPALLLEIDGVSLSRAILEERRESNR